MSSFDICVDEYRGSLYFANGDEAEKTANR